MMLSLRDGICQGRKLPLADDVLMSRVELLGREDRDLVDAVVFRGQSVSSVARLMRVSPRVVRTRILHLTRRMAGRSFLDAARALSNLAPEDAEIAKAAFCQGISQRDLCRQLGMTAHALRRRLDRISAQIATIRLMSERQMAGSR